MKLLRSMVTPFVGAFIGIVMTLALQSVGAKSLVQPTQDPNGWYQYCNGYVYCIPFFTPTPIVGGTSAPSPTATRTATITASPTVTATRTASPTPTQVAVSPTMTQTNGCTALPCWNDIDRRFEVIASVSLCADAAPCYGDPDRFLRLIAVGEIRHVLCLYTISPTNIWASEFKCNAAFDRSWNALQYGSRIYMRLLE